MYLGNNKPIIEIQKVFTGTHALNKKKIKKIQEVIVKNR